MFFCAKPVIRIFDENDDLVVSPNPNHDEEKYQYFFKGN